MQHAEPLRMKCWPHWLLGSSSSKPPCLLSAAVACPLPQVVCWLRPMIVKHLLEQGYVVYSTGKQAAQLPGSAEASLTCYLAAPAGLFYSLPLPPCCGALPVPGCCDYCCCRCSTKDFPHCLHADSDVAFVVKPVWPSYMNYIGEVQADGSFQAEYGSGGQSAAACACVVRSWEAQQP